MVLYSVGNSLHRVIRPLILPLLGIGTIVSCQLSRGRARVRLIGDDGGLRGPTWKTSRADRKFSRENLASGGGCSNRADGLDLLLDLLTIVPEKLAG